MRYMHGRNRTKFGFKRKSRAADISLLSIGIHGVRKRVPRLAYYHNGRKENGRQARKRNLGTLINAD